MTVRCLILLLLFPISSFGRQQYYGSRVSEIDLSGSPTLSDLQLLPIRRGDVITPDNIRQSIQVLYDTHRYSYIEVEGEAESDGTKLTFHVRPYYFFSTFRVVPDNLLDRSLSGFLRLPFGERFSQTVVDRLTGETQTLLQNEGYFDAKVTATTSFEEATHLATVEFNVQTQGRARIGSVKITGGEDTFPDRSKLYDAFGIKSGTSFSLDKFDSGTKKLREKFSNLPVGGFLNTRVEATKDYKADTNTVDINVTIEPGKFTLVETPGYKISPSKIKELVPFFEEGTVDPDLIKEGQTRILNYMQQEGYFDAQVQAETIDDTLNNAIQINYHINKGEHHHIEAVHIEGNAYFTDEDLKDRMKIRGQGVIGHGMFSRELLETDRKTIQSMYVNAGFVDVKVDGEVAEKDHSLTITITIDEGKRFPIETIEFTGNQNVPTSELAERTGLHEGSIYMPASVEQARNSLTSMYFAKGFPDARVEQSVERIAPDNKYRVTFQITEGDRYTIGQIFVAGSVLTAPKIVHRNANLYASQPYNPEALLDSQQRLYATGLFNRVDVVPMQQDIQGVRNVLIQVEDAKRILFAYGFGYQEFQRARATIQITHNNLFGLDRSLTSRLQASFREDTLQSTYHEPRLFNRNLDGYASILWDYSDLPAFTGTQLQGSIEVLKRFSKIQTLDFSLAYQKINLKDIRVNPHLEEFPDETGVVTISELGTSYVRDRRNDPINTTSGTFETSTVQFATRRLGGEVNFTSLFNQSNFFFPTNNPINNSVIATSIRMGWIRPFGVTQQAPITVRYFAGGSTTLRGYNLYEAGVAGGGDVEVIGNFEYRFPMRWMPIKNVGGVAFYDTGDVYANWSQVRPSNFSQILGAGFRYNTPLGPVRFDIGFNLYQPPIDAIPQKTVHFYFTLGQMF